MRRVLELSAGWVLLCALSSLPANAQAPGRRTLGPLEQVPLLKVEPDGTTSSLRLAALQDGPLVLYFYGEDCSDCTEHLAYLQRLERTTGSYRSFKILAVAVRFGAKPDHRPRSLGEVIPVVDEGGRLWKAILELPATDSPPGAREKAARLLPVTVFLGRWMVRNYGTARVAMDRYVSLRTMLIGALTGPGPTLPEIDIEDEDALATGDWTPRPADAGTVAH